jgi:hypothetical protein
MGSGVLMPEGICPLCRLSKTLVDSHLAPKAMYKYARNPNEQNSVPVVVTKGRVEKVVRQVKKYLLCAECDSSLSANGENYVLTQMWNGKTFPLLERLNVAVVAKQEGDVSVYSGSAVGVDTEKLAHFALSVLWRTSVCEWRTSKVTSHRVDLGTHQEVLRAYLHGESPFPQDVTVLTAVCTDGFSRTFYMPTVATFRLPVHIPAFTFLAMGISFLIILGPFAAPDICCVRSPTKRIYRRDCSKKIIEAFSLLQM